MQLYVECADCCSTAARTGTRVLSINPGFASTRLGLFEGEKVVFKATISHSSEELAGYFSCSEQLSFRKEAVLSFLSSNGVSLESLTAVIGRGGVLKPLGAGTYRVNDRMIADLGRPREDHPSNLGGIIAYEIAKEAGIPAYIADPMSVDELTDVARISGLKEIERRGPDHVLNVRATAFKYAHGHDWRLSDINLVVAHLGGGISIVPFRKGEMVDVNRANGMGSFSPERTAGLVSRMGANNLREVKRRIACGDVEARLVFVALCYRIAKEIGAMAAVLKGELHAIVLTGALACDEELITDLIDRVGWIAPIVAYPGEDELEALNSAVLRLMSGEEREKEYR